MQSRPDLILAAVAGGTVKLPDLGEVCSACSHIQPNTVAVTEGEHAGEFVCQGCLNILIKAARLGIDDGKRIVDQAAALGGIPTGRGRRRH